MRRFCRRSVAFVVLALLLLVALVWKPKTAIDTFLVHQWTCVGNMVYIYTHIYVYMIYRDDISEKKSVQRLCACHRQKDLELFHLIFDQGWIEMGIEMVPISRHWSWNFGKLTGASKIATWVCVTVGHHWKTRFVVVGQFLIGVVEGFLSGLWGYLTTDWLPWTWGAWSKWEAIRRQTSDFFAY